MLAGTQRMFEGLGVGNTSYDYLAIAIHHLHNACPRVKTLQVGDKQVELPQPPHGFTTYPLDEERLTILPVELREFFGEALTGDGPRLTILTDVYRSERTEQNEPIPDGHIEIGRWLIGEDLHYILQMNSQDKCVEIRVTRGGYYDDGPYWGLYTNPERTLEVRFLTEVDGKYTLDDPRNFRATVEPLPDDLDALLASVLTFAIRERRLQLLETTR